MYEYEMKNNSPIVQHPTRNNCGKYVVRTTFSFIMDCWYSCTICEHVTEGDLITRSKGGK
jgi:hypothetical protein